MICPHCSKPIPARLIRSEAGRLSAAARETHAGGRPRAEDRCPCGKYSKHTAELRRHVCALDPTGLK